MLSQTVMTVSLCVAALIFGAFANRADSQGKAKVLLTKPTKKKVMPSSFKPNVTTVEPVHYSLVPSASTLVLPSLSLEDIPVYVPATKSARLLKSEAKATSSLAEVRTHKMKEMDAVESTGMSELEVNKARPDDAPASAAGNASKTDEQEGEAPLGEAPAPAAVNAPGTDAREGEAPLGEATAPAAVNAPRTDAQEEALSDADAKKFMEAAKQQAFNVALAVKDSVAVQKMLVLTIDTFESVRTSTGSAATKVAESEKFGKLVEGACAALDRAKTALPANKEDALAILVTAKEAVEEVAGWAAKFAKKHGGPAAENLKKLATEVREVIEKFVTDQTQQLKQKLEPHAADALEAVKAHPLVERAWTASEPFRKGATEAADAARTATKPLLDVATNKAAEALTASKDHIGRVQRAATKAIEAARADWNETHPEAAEEHVTSAAATGKENAV